MGLGVLRVARGISMGWTSARFVRVLLRAYQRCARSRWAGMGGLRSLRGQLVDILQYKPQTNPAAQLGALNIRSVYLKRRIFSTHQKCLSIQMGWDGYGV